MPLVSTGDLVHQAACQGGSVPAFNVITLEHAEGIVEGAEQASRPVIAQLSENAIKYHRRPEPIAAAIVALARASTAQVSFHLDHVTDPSLIRLAPELDAGSVMYDGASLPYEKNVVQTREIAGWAHRHGIWVEAELGEIGGKDGAHTPGVRTAPHEAVKFVHSTGVDALAVAVGSSHAMSTKTASLDHELISRLRNTLDVPLVLHGSSGVPDTELARASANGMAKINIGTTLNLAYTGEIRTYLVQHVDTVDPRKYLTLSRAAMAATVAHTLAALGSQATDTSSS